MTHLRSSDGASRRASTLPASLALAVLLLPATALAARSGPLVHHEVEARLEPSTHRLEVRDRLAIPAPLVGADLAFALNADLAVRCATPGLSLTAVKQGVFGADVGMDREDDGPENRVKVNVYRVDGARAGQPLTLELTYGGVIDNPVKEAGPQYARGFSQSPGLIEEQGVYLAGSTFWIPQVQDALLTYRLAVDLPAGWKSVAQGERTPAGAPPTAGARVQETWALESPTEEIHLIAARFTEYLREAGAVKAYAFLRTPDEALATRYLEATAQDLELYRGLVGPYPYSKFALVENFWETGYGMPSFTLLGEQIIRFPFILTSSYPHELLHNWWGNGVFVDFAGGNWCEGLTAYLADHLFAEQRGQGNEHRRDVLQRVTDYVTPQADFPVRKFKTRSDAVTEAVGYGKTAMMWNMLRVRLGDEDFRKGLQRFWRDNRFKTAGFDDLRVAFEAVSKEDLEPFFEQWLTRTGLPELKLGEVKRSGQRLTLNLSQIQPGAPFALEVPVAVHTARGVQARSVTLTGRDATATFDLDAPATRVEIDPQFQVYRRLSPFEIPPSLSKAFGASKVTIVVPAGEPAAPYAGLLKAWAKPGVEVVEDRALAKLPDDRATWIVGAGNKFAAALAPALAAQGGALEAGALRLGATSYPLDQKSVVVALRHPEHPALVRVFLSAPTAAAADGLARKLPHYGKYSWLVFKGEAPDNEGKGEWPPGVSPLVRDLEPQATVARLPLRKALAELAPTFDAARMKADVAWLAAPERTGRGVGTAGLETAAGWLAEAFKKIGLKPLRAGGDYFERFELAGPDGKPVAVKNVLGVVPGSNPAFTGQALVISAHYDHLGLGWPDAHQGDLGKLHPGADDNASGVAVLLELARALANAHPPRTLIFAAFTGEEAGLAGARAFVRGARAADAPYPLAGLMADLNVDTVGRLEGGKVDVLGADSAREWPFIFGGAAAVTGVPTTVVTRPLTASDQGAFIEAGVPGVQLFASTAADYHRPGDTADKIDAGGLVKVAMVLREAADYLSTRPEPLHFAAPSAAAAPGGPAGPPAGATGPRRASTGVVPDMGFDGEGVRVASVAPGSGAEKAGLQAGDRLMAIAGRKTPDLKAWSEVLKTLAPGDVVEVEVARGEDWIKAQVTLGAR